MFDLEPAIANWRQQMLAAGIQTPMPLEELESHLREAVEQQMRSGVNAQQAFETAVRQIGRARELKFEFKKTDNSIGARFAELTGIAWGVIAGWFLLWTLFFLFTVHDVNWVGRILGLQAIVSTGLSWRYGYLVLPVIRHRHIRTMIGFACCTAGIVWMGIFVKLILPSLVILPTTVDTSPARLMVSFLWAWTVAATLASMAHGLEKAASRQDQHAVS
jgi:hypothetical protein